MMTEVQLEGYIACEGCDKFYHHTALKNTKYGLVCFSCFIVNAEEEIGQLEAKDIFLIVKTKECNELKERIKELEENNTELVRIIGEYPSALDLDEKEEAYKKKIKELYDFAWSLQKRIAKEIAKEEEEKEMMSND